MRLEKRRRRTLPILQTGFRPFFLGAALWAVFALLHWLHLLAGMGTEASAMTPLAWHRHEMVFGYTSAVITGFLLTAVPNWTGRLPVNGPPLLFLFLLWLAGRLANLASASIGALPAMVVDVAFLWTVTAIAAREVIGGGNRRNMPVVLLVGLLAAASTLSHLEPALGLATADMAWRLGLAVILTLIGLIGGRIVPSFTGNWLKKQGEARLPASFGAFDKAAMATLPPALLLWTALPYSPMSGALLVLAGAAVLARLARWRGHRTWPEPLVLILHVGYGWLGLGLLLLGGTILHPPLAVLSANHALTAGAIATMTLAVMTRASLGHTGRPLTAGRATQAIYALVTLGALLRVTAGLLPMSHSLALTASATAWTAAFALFALTYGPMLVRRRAES